MLYRGWQGQCVRELSCKPATIRSGRQRFRICLRECATRARREATSSARTRHGEEVRVQAKDGQILDLSVTVVSRTDRCSLVLPALHDSRFLIFLNGCVESTKGREQPVGGGLPVCASKGNGLVCCAA